jgi:nitrite reductase/ring-hydroxylating ferredoxin subunit
MADFHCGPWPAEDMQTNDTAPSDDAWNPLCPGSELLDGGLACSFDVNYAGQHCRAFALRYQGRVHAYLNRCSHVAMEMDWQPDRFFDLTGHHIVCASHGALFRPDTGRCVGGPGRGGLFKIETLERDGGVFWRSQYHLKPVSF